MLPLDFTCTATCRPAIAARTFESFARHLVGVDFSASTLHLNLDPLPEGSDGAGVVAVASQIFGHVRVNSPPAASFPVAVKWCFAQPAGEFFFHLEDDWLLVEPIEIAEMIGHLRASADLSLVNLRAYGHDDDRLCLAPGLWRTSHARAIGVKLRTDWNPEQQLRMPGLHNPHGGVHHGYRGIQFPQRRVIRDIGREWMRENNLHRAGEAKFTTWAAGKSRGGIQSEPPPKPRPRMVTPRDKLNSRANDIIQICVTRKCDIFHCSNCTQLLPYRRDPVEMSVDVFRQAVRTLVDWPGVVAMFGGNPCTHSRFADLCQIMREEIPDQKHRGIWTNNLMEHGELVRATFYPHGRHNLNVHTNAEAAAEMRKWLPGWKIWGERPSHHSPVLLDYRDFGLAEADWIKLRDSCDINQNWSAAIAERDGQPMAYFCEVAAALDGVRGENNGIPVEAGWWTWPMMRYAHQVANCCDRGCGVPLRRSGHLDNANTYDVSPGLVDLTIRGKATATKLHTQLPPARHEFTDYIGLRQPADATR